MLVAARALDGLETAWIVTRLAVRGFIERTSPCGVFAGAAAEPPTDEYAACAAELHPEGEDLSEMFAALDRAVAKVRTLVREHPPLLGCIATQLDGHRVHGAHVGIGRALVFRAGSAVVDSLVVEHYHDRVRDREVPSALRELLDSDFAGPVVVNALGALKNGLGVVDRFETELARGDVLLVSSHRLGVSDEEVAALVQRHATLSLDELASVIAARAGDETHDVAFAVARLRADCT